MKMRSHYPLKEKSHPKWLTAFQRLTPRLNPIGGNNTSCIFKQGVDFFSNVNQSNLHSKYFSWYQPVLHLSGPGIMVSKRAILSHTGLYLLRERERKIEREKGTRDDSSYSLTGCFFEYIILPEKLFCICWPCFCVFSAFYLWMNYLVCLQDGHWFPKNQLITAANWVLSDFLNALILKVYYIGGNSIMCVSYIWGTHLYFDRGHYILYHSWK